MCVARDELLTLLDHVDLKNVPIARERVETRLMPTLGRAIGAGLRGHGRHRACDACPACRATQVFFANKMDLPTALTPVECVQHLELHKITDKPWHISCALPA